PTAPRRRAPAPSRRILRPRPSRTARPPPPRAPGARTARSPRGGPGRTPRACRARRAGRVRWRGPTRPATAPPARPQWPEPRRRYAAAGCGTSGGGGGRDFAEPPVAPLVVEDGLEQIAPGDVGPQHRRHVQLGVSELPQQEVRDPQLTRGADQQIGVAPGGGVELFT